MSGACEKSCCSACRHGHHSQWRCEPAGCREAAREEGLRGRRASVWSASRAASGLGGRWEAMRTLSSRPFCSCDSRQVSLWDLSAGLRYTTHRQISEKITSIISMPCYLTTKSDGMGKFPEFPTVLVPRLPWLWRCETRHVRRSQSPRGLQRLQ